MIPIFYTGRYGLVDLYYRHIWINIPNEKIAHAVRLAFGGHAKCAVWDLVTFENYSDQTVDSDVCLNWKVGHTADAAITNFNVITDFKLLETQTQCLNNLLINEPSRCLLTAERKQELQKMMLLYARILERTSLHNIADYLNMEWTNFCFPGDDVFGPDRNFFNKMNQLFSSEIHLEKIETALAHLCYDYFAELPVIASDILVILEKLYA